MNVKFDTSENILEWTPALFMVSEVKEVFAYVKMIKCEKMNLIESELDAIKRTEQLKRINEELGIFKPDAYYYYAKAAFMEINDKGVVRQEEHFFKNSEGDNLTICLN